MNLDFFRLRLARLDTGMPWLALLALLTGLLAGAVVVAFRLLVEGVQGAFLPGGEVEHYEGLPPWARLALPAAAGLLLGLAFQALPPQARAVGVVYVRERLVYFQGRLGWLNGLVQFFGAALSIIGGHSVGREGPAVHLGATPGSLLAQGLALPHNVTRILVACGAAGAIGAAFDTPLAGVVFAMEVILQEYTVAGFLPIIVAAVTATAVARLVYGSDPAFAVPDLGPLPVAELPWVAAAGVVLGGVAVLFVRLLEGFTRWGRPLPWVWRLSLGGLAVGVVAVGVPEVMGIGYDTVSAALAGQLGLALLVSITLAKVLATAAGIGLGLPGGLIGPTLVMGATAGGALGLVAAQLYPAHGVDPGLYALLGMGALMGAVLQAPMSALTALLELTGDTNVILPGMTAIVCANLTASEVFAHRRSVFAVLLSARGLDYDEHPAAMALRRVGVLSALETAVALVPRRLSRARLEAVLARRPRYLLVEEADGEIHTLLPAAEVQAYLEAHPRLQTVDLETIPARRLQVAPLDFRATLEDAWRLMRERHVQALYVYRPAPRHVYGILTEEEVLRHRAGP